MKCEIQVLLTKYKSSQPSHPSLDGIQEIILQP